MKKILFVNFILLIFVRTLQAIPSLSQEIPIQKGSSSRSTSSFNPLKNFMQQNKNTLRIGGTALFPLIVFLGSCSKRTSSGGIETVSPSLTSVVISLGATLIPLQLFSEVMEEKQKSTRKPTIWPTLISGMMTGITGVVSLLAFTVGNWSIMECYPGHGFIAQKTVFLTNNGGAIALIPLTWYFFEKTQHKYQQYCAFKK